jgi:hypothetical protein
MVDEGQVGRWAGVVGWTYMVGPALAWAKEVQWLGDNFLPFWHPYIEVFYIMTIIFLSCLFKYMFINSKI